MQVEYQELVQKNRALKKQNHQLYQEIKRLGNDPGAIEHLARQELGLVKEGELLFLFPKAVPEAQP
jgi:cell division protein FtsB